MKSFALLAAAGVAASALASPIQKPQPVRNNKPMNIVFLLADDLGARDLGCYGSSFYDTPHLDRLASQGALFTQAYAACPVCSPTRSSILTGQYPTRTGVTDFIGAALPQKWNRNTKMLPAPYAKQLAKEKITIAEVLKSQGYATGFFGKWHLGPEGFWPEDQGFDVNKGGHSAGAPGSGGKYFSPYNNPRLEDGPPGEHLPDRLANEACTFLQANRDKPFLAYFSFYDVHTPLMARPDLQAKYEKRRRERDSKTRWGREGTRDVRLSQDHAIYAGMVEAMDAAAGKVLAKLDELKLTQNTIVVFTSDNGGLSTSEGWPTSNAPLRAGKGWLYEGGIREALLVRWPKVTRAGSRVDAPISSPDFFTTFLRATNAAPPANQPLDGIDLQPVLHGEKSPERALFWHYPHYGNQGGAPGSAIRRGDWKLIEWFEDDRAELFNIREDEGEARDVSAQHPERVRALRRELSEWRTQTGAKMPSTNPNYDASQPDGRDGGRPAELRGLQEPPKYLRGLLKPALLRTELFSGAEAS